MVVEVVVVVVVGLDVVWGESSVGVEELRQELNCTGARGIGTGNVDLGSKGSGRSLKDIHGRVCRSNDRRRRRVTLSSR